MQKPFFDPVYSKRSIINIFKFPCCGARTPRSYQHILLLVYYRLFNEDGPLKVQNTIHSAYPYIGRLDANNVPPPHTTSSLAKCICTEEGKRVEFLENGVLRVYWNGGLAYTADLFKTLSSPMPYPIMLPLSLFTHEYPGMNPQDPLVLKVVPIRHVEEKILSATCLTK